MELEKKKWTLEEAIDDYRKGRSGKKCTNCEFGNVVAECKVKRGLAFHDGELRARFCKYFSPKV